MLGDQESARSVRRFRQWELALLLVVSIPLYLASSAGVESLLAITPQYRAGRTAAVLVVPLMFLFVVSILILTSHYLAARCAVIAIAVFGLLGLCADAGYLQRPAVRITVASVTVLVIVLNASRLRREP
jgi:hypothetical protein